MNITHDSMMALTADMPCKTIEINGEKYLERYFAHQLADGTQVWYHRFLRNDSERHLHSHPWRARSVILCGFCIEERLSEGGKKDRIHYLPGHLNHINQGTTHRIVEVEPDTWTQMIVSPGRHPKWYFIDDNGNETEMPTNPFEWHQDFKPRAAA